MKLIAVEGNISAGKSTLLPALAVHMTELTGDNWEIIKEPVDEDPEFHRLLKQFIENPEDADKRVEFQLYLTNQRSELLKDIKDGHYLIERSLFSDLVFSQVNFLSMERPSAHYMKYYYDIKERLTHYPQVDLVIYLNRDPEACFETMKHRARDGEDGYELEYFEDLHRFHEACLPQITRQYKTDYLDWKLGNCFPDARILAPQIVEILKERHSSDAKESK